MRSGKALTEYVAEESTIPAYMALHLASECARLGSVAPKHFVPHVKPPPRLQVSSDAQEPDEEKHGSLASGKSTLIKTLATWAVKSGRTKVKGPGLLLVNLNPNDVGWTVPGTFSVAPLDVLIPTTTPVLPFGSTPTTGSSTATNGEGGFPINIDVEIELWLNKFQVRLKYVVEINLCRNLI
ncbi:uncharacterized protein PGTG_18348 [Puccinia graminis f. sp. tritici CRL 75-36-700-3]|uniref:Uncharacterized protein n=1 Tax=Puccinia graminis f. sp. tritici (strain CRL 75-36-700-3 / race SCCL) TaxID=418459 RepID=E3L738_PUCGT|nr:uncharacterized protein PGTG_18348 [Puccinia graminis f. sp. tritici CRL 75-36-700-3]EFP92361.2 hypothetical protein PGTG_18348 [Puccinia graminis f. sp. tritici CRL 75-36-700-3]